MDNELDLPNAPDLPAAFDTPITRATIDTLPIDTLDNWLTTLRERRLHIVERIAKVREIKERQYINDVMTKYVKLYARLKAKLEVIDTAIGVAEGYSIKLRSMWIEVEDADADE